MLKEARDLPIECHLQKFEISDFTMSLQQDFLDVRFRLFCTEYSAARLPTGPAGGQTASPRKTLVSTQHVAASVKRSVLELSLTLRVSANM